MFRHPEARAKRASKGDGASRVPQQERGPSATRVILRGPHRSQVYAGCACYGGHLRMTKLSSRWRDYDGSALDAVGMRSARVPSQKIEDRAVEDFGLLPIHGVS